MVIVDSIEKFNEFKDSIVSNDIIIIPVFMSTTLHPIKNGVSLLYAKDINTNSKYTLPIDHPDISFKISSSDLESLTHSNCYILNKWELSYHLDIKNSIDISFINYLHNGKVLEVSDNEGFDFYNYYFANRPDVAKIVPIAKHIEYCDNTIDKIKDLPEYNNWTYKFYDDAIYLFSEIEKAGICVDVDRFKDRYNSKMLVGNIAHTKYNLLTAAGRPSNRFGGINFAALNKDDGTREMFISRFENGKLLEFDYDAYHLRLIADLIGYDFPDSSIHEHLGKLYFKKDSLTQEEYELSKRISFKALYGFIPKEYKNIKFFQGIEIFIIELWKGFNSDGFVQSQISKRRFTKEYFSDLNATKLFNYYIQFYETEKNILVIEELLSFLKGKKTKLIKYLYDAFIFDMHPNEQHIVEDLENIISKGGFPTRTKIGDNYHDLRYLYSKEKIHESN
jgi:hypothetical protein